jgi:hypothetical protein
MCAPPVVTARWPRVWRWAGAADGTQPGGEVQGTQWAQLTQEEGKARGKVGPDDEAAGLA